ncbi:hypothetical protein YC2023_042921 [Brassica napus]
MSDSDRFGFIFIGSGSVRIFGFGLFAQPYPKLIDRAEICFYYFMLTCKCYTKLVMIVEELATKAKFEVLGGKSPLPSFLLKILQEIPNWMTSSSAIVEDTIVLGSANHVVQGKTHQCQYLPQSHKTFHERVPPTNAYQKKKANNYTIDKLYGSLRSIRIDSNCQELEAGHETMVVSHRREERSVHVDHLSSNVLGCMQSICVQNLLSSKTVRSFENIRKEEINVMMDKLEKASSSLSRVNLSKLLMTYK